MYSRVLYDTVTISYFFKRTNHLIFVIERQRVYCELGTELALIVQ